MGGQRGVQNCFWGKGLMVCFPSLELPPPPPPCHPHGNKHISNSQRFLDVHVFVLSSNSLAKNNVHMCVSESITRDIPAKSASYVHAIPHQFVILTRERSQKFEVMNF